METITAPVTFAAKRSTMITIDDRLYRDMARLLIEAAGAGEFFNGVVDHSAEDFYATLTATLIIYRNGGRIKDIVPVWWEFHLLQDKGEELTDFCWTDFREFLGEYF